MRFDLQRGPEVLARTPATLSALLEGLTDEWTCSDEGVGTWSPFAVVGHLIHGERTDWIPRARLILERGAERAFEHFDREAQAVESVGKSLGELLVEFAALRRENLATLSSWGLATADLTRCGLHPELGAVTLGQLLATWVVHDLGHVRQIARTMARQYASEVGPWRAYLPVLSD